ncbi:MAG: hypothetical protein H7Y20_18560 [Bryobacteraceae bacterium]|nr:hypothetical protein [Bryobacteraceae bacterium]
MLKFPMEAQQDANVKNPFAIRSGKLCMVGGAWFAVDFLAAPPLLNLFSLSPDLVRLLRCVSWCIVSVLLTAGPVGLIALHSLNHFFRRRLAVAGAVLALTGCALWIVGSVVIFNAPETALRQRFTPGGSVLIALGTLLMALAVSSSRIPGRWHKAAAYAAALYFPAQLTLQVSFFLGKGHGPMSILLGLWGVVWLLLGYSIWRSASARVHAARPSEMLVVH